MKNSIFVGSFNPVTKAHLKIAEDLIKEHLTDYVYFIPVNSKKINLIKIDKRLDMLNLVIKEKMATLDIYNYDALGLFNYYVLEHLNDTLKINSIIMGADLVLKIKTFLEYENILKKYHIIVIKRDDIAIEQFIKEELPSFQERFLIINKTYQASSTKARACLKNQKNHYLDRKVLAYIRENNLYD